MTTVPAWAGHPEPRPTGFTPARGLAWLGAAVAGGVLVSGVYAVTGVGLPCPFLALTGWPCPLCGGTRMGAALLRLDPAAALTANPLLLAGVAVLAVLAALWVVELAGGPAVRPSPRLRRRLRLVSPMAWLVIGLTFAAAYTVVRQVLPYP